ncbi:hypothetical protein [Bacillus cereus]|uniref:hypothetical protein n=1 Tax=Bacillaceae TaxID=186817 RepID=UPI0038044C95
MAFENGDRIEDYFGQNIENYKKDNLIFVKSLAILTTFLNRKDWPHCIEELEEIITPILGTDLIGMGFHGFYFENDYIKWPSNLPDTYKKDAISFYKTVNPIVMQYFFNRLEPLKLFSIVSTQDRYEPDKKIIRFIRNDGESLEVQFDRSSIEEAISVLNQLLESKPYGE